MVELIKQTKDVVLERLDRAINEKGADRMNVQEVGMLADVVKDLADAEKSCWEAEYYRSVSEAMEQGSMGYDGHVQPNSYGYRGQARDSMGRYSARRGYRGMAGYGHDDMMQEVRQMIEMADPQERDRLKMQLRKMAE